MDSVADLMTKAMESISSTISSAESSTISSVLHLDGRNASGAEKPIKQFVMEVKIPTWNSVPMEPVHVLEHQLPRMAPQVG